MIVLKTLTIKNFLSIGNIVQTVNLSNTDLVLVLGENLDIGGNDSRNGTGKSGIANALSYALYGTALTNIKRDNLINKTNLKNMFVTLDFEKDGVSYRIERGRKPGIFRFIKNNVDVANNTTVDENDAQGENRHTQESIERLLNISHDMFKHIISLNTYVEPFLSLRSNDQRMIIEQLLGITKLSEKAEVLKEEIKKVKDLVKEQEFLIQSTNETNKRINENIITLEKKSSSWENNKQNTINKLQSSILALMEVNISDEITKHKVKSEVTELVREYNSLVKDLTVVEKDIKNYTTQVNKGVENLSSTANKVCPVCDHELGDETHEKVHGLYETQVNEAKEKLEKQLKKKDEIVNLINNIKPNIPEMPETFYKTVDEAYSHKTTLDTFGNQLEGEIESVNPFIDQIDSLKQNGLQLVDFTKINDLANSRDHMEFLQKLLTSKDSFIRKRIIDQNLTYLNHRLAYYLEKIGLPHIVKFKSDLEVEITMFGKDFDFDNLSRGERTRLILSLSWAFRDVYESLYSKINLLFIDELLDNGIDSAGIEGALSLLKKMSRDNHKDILLISHREELVSRIDNVLKVVKEGGFTTIEIKSL